MRTFAEPARLAAELLDGRTEVRVLSAMAPEQPDALLAALLRVARERSVAVRLLVADTTGAFRFLDADGERALADGSLSITLLAGSVPRRLAPSVDSLPVSLWEVDGLLASGALPVDLFLVKAHRAASGPALELGRTVGYTPTAFGLRGVRVAVEVSGDVAAPGLAPVDAAVWHDAVAIETPPTAAGGAPAARPAADPVRDAIIGHLAPLIPDVATLQVGIGGVAESLLDAVAGRRAIRIHSGILPNGLRAHLAAGRFTGGARPGDRGLAIATSLAPDAGPAAWPAAARLEPISATHDPAVLAVQPSLWAVNSAFSVDLGGQVDAERVGGLKLACGAGQLDFARAAHASRGGASVIALPARSSRGLPRIVARLEGVTTPANDVDVVVTEFGAAVLTGRSVRERAEALIAVAHPDDRAGLAAGP